MFPLRSSDRITYKRTMQRQTREKNEWKLELIESLANANTRRNYQSVVDMLEDHFDGFTGKESTLELIRFVRKQQGKVSPQSLKQRVSVLKTIIEHARLAKIRSDNPVDRSWSPKVNIEVRPKCPSAQELKSLDNVLKNETGFLGARSKAIIALFRYEALRVHEVAGLNHPDFNYHKSGIELKVRGKGGFETSIQLYPQSCKLVNEYKKYIPIDERYGPFFIPCFELGKRLDTRSIRKVCTHLFKKAGWTKGLSCHSLRHYVCVQLLEAGVPITEVQRKLRHRFISSTFTYYSNVPSLRSTEKLSTAHKFLGGI